MRTILATVLSITALAAAAAGTAFQATDLNRPGVLEQLRTERPKHFKAITEILQVAERVPCPDRRLEAIRTRYDMCDLECNFLVLTSFPPKRRLSFALDETNYVATVTLKDAGGRLVPAVS